MGMENIKEHIRRAALCEFETQLIVAALRFAVKEDLDINHAPCPRHKATTVWDHIQHVAQKVNQGFDLVENHRGAREILLVVAYFHDICKPVEEDYNHPELAEKLFREQVGPYLVKEELLTAEEAELCRSLIERHMMLYSLDINNLPRASKFMHSPKWAHIDLLLTFSLADSADSDACEANKKLVSRILELIE